MKTIIVKDRDHLKQIIKESDNNADLNHLDVTKVTDMSFMFNNSKFNHDISTWTVTKVTDMYAMFREHLIYPDIETYQEYINVRTTTVNLGILGDVLQL